MQSLWYSRDVSWSGVVAAQRHHGVAHACASLRNDITECARIDAIAHASCGVRTELRAAMSLRDAQSPGDISSLVMLMSFFKLLTIHLTMTPFHPVYVRESLQCGSYDGTN